MLLDPYFQQFIKNNGSGYELISGRGQRHFCARCGKDIFGLRCRSCGQYYDSPVTESLLCYCSGISLKVWRLECV